MQILYMRKAEEKLSKWQTPGASCSGTNQEQEATTVMAQLGE